MIVDKKNKEVIAEEPSKVEKDVPKYRARVVGTQVLIVRDKPEGTRIGTIGDGHVVKVYEDKDGWSKVKWGDYTDKDGYVKTEFIKNVEDQDKIRPRVNGIGIGQ